MSNFKIAETGKVGKYHVTILGTIENDIPVIDVIWNPQPPDGTKLNKKDRGEYIRLRDPVIAALIEHLRIPPEYVLIVE